MNSRIDEIAASSPIATGTTCISPSSPSFSAFGHGVHGRGLLPVSPTLP
eukprot:COSAG05_NODE_8596_length_689_cov_1.737288_1_plen_48_part_10